MTDASEIIQIIKYVFLNVFLLKSFFSNLQMPLKITANSAGKRVRPAKWPKNLKKAMSTGISLKFGIE